MHFEEDKSVLLPADSDRQHIPVMLEESVSLLNVRKSRLSIDATAGAGGHLNKICQLRGSSDGVIALDRDLGALECLRQQAQTGPLSGLTFVHSNFAQLAAVLARLGIDAVDGGILADLGVSSMQLAESSRGFSFLREGPLDMRMDVNNSLSVKAHEIVNSWAEADLANIIYQYGEETRSRMIARGIVNNRPIHTTLALAEIVAAVLTKHGHHRRRQQKFSSRKPSAHPATRTFQALRIAVNDELDSLRQFLEQAAMLLTPGARLVVITFHSLEDRIVKQFFKQKASNCICPPRQPVCTCKKKPEFLIITPKPLIASEKEVLANIRSRSAKLRAGEKLF
jgi:16S rRNA (cytosine1402-N4)-methyltransferase